MISLDSLAALISHYGYAFLLPAAIIEGPVVTVIAAFLASLGVLDIVWVYAIAVAGDVIGDSIYYWIGRLGRTTLIPKYGHWVGLTPERIARAEEHYKDHLGKTLLFGKVTQAPILIIIVAAGAARADFLRLLGLVFLITLPKALIFLLVGYFAGRSYAAIGHGLDIALIVIWAVLIAGFVIYRTWRRPRSSD
jgi:membrane protein DedA with SNARE-associated domain